MSDYKGSNRIRLSSGPFHYLSWNADRPELPAAVLLHGLTSSCSSWHRIGPALSDHRVFALDLRGHGQSPHPSHSLYSLDRFTDDVLELIEALDLYQPVLVGHSWGGAVALAVGSSRSATRTHTPRALVLEDPVHSLGNEKQRVMAGHMRQLQDLGDDDLRSALRTGRPPVHPDQLTQRMQEIRMTSPDLLEHIGAPNIAPYSLLPCFAELRCPTLLLLADSRLSSVFDDQAVHRATQLAPAGTRSLRVPDAPHTVHTSEPERFVAEVRAFLRSVETMAGHG